jgi:nitroreductase
MTISTEELLRVLRWRYATKKFDPAKKIPAATWNALEQALILSPSSYGLQPWKFLILTDPKLREKLVPHSWNQRQVADASHLVVFAVKKKISAADVDAWVTRMAEAQDMEPEKLNGYRGMMIQDVVEGPRSRWAEEWAVRQAYIALGNFMTSAAFLGVDTCPMEGFIPEKYDEILGLADEGLRTAVLCPAGYRSAEDKYAAQPKIRFASERLIERR